MKRVCLLSSQSFGVSGSHTHPGELLNIVCMFALCCPWSLASAIRPFKFWAEKPHRPHGGKLWHRTDGWMWAQNVPKSQVNDVPSFVMRTPWLSLFPSIILLVPCERMRASAGETEEVISCVGLVLTDHDVTCHPLSSVKVPSLEFLVLSNENVWWQENVKGPLLWHHSVSGVFVIVLKMLILKYAQRVS